jgi:hypothetical protein
LTQIYGVVVHQSCAIGDEEDRSISALARGLSKLSNKVREVAGPGV